MTTEKKFEKGMWQGSRYRNNSDVQIAAMGQTPRSTEHILVVSAVIS